MNPVAFGVLLALPFAIVLGIILDDVPLWVAFVCWAIAGAVAIGLWYLVEILVTKGLIK